MDKENKDSEINSIFDESDKEIGGTKKSIIELFDEQIKQKKQSFINLPNILQKKEQIKRLSLNLKSDIKNLEQIISDLLDRQKDDYLAAFSQFMDSIKNNLTAQLEEIEKAFEEKRKANDVRVVHCERDFFKSEAIRLNNLCKKLKEELADINFKYKFTKAELANIKIKYKETENINKKLLSDIENNIIENNKSKSLIKEKINLKKSIKNKSIIVHNSENNNNSNCYKNKNNILKMDNLENSTIFKNESIARNVNSLNNLLKRSKNEAKKEKEKANKAIAELSKIYLEKNKLANIFQNCVEETKKIIFNRKMLENKFYKVKNSSGILKYDIEHRINFKTKFEDFLPSDKQKTLEKFIFDDEVYNVVKDIIFKFPKNNKIKDLLNNSYMMNTLQCSGDDSKLKRVIDIPKIKCYKKTKEILPLMINTKLSFINKNSQKKEESHKNRALTINK